MALCDLYIDSFPFAGACSMLDPLLAGLPPVVYGFGHFRGLLSTAMLRECGLGDMATATESDYLDRAEHLIRDAAFRTAEAERVKAVRDRGLPFFDSKTYGQRLANLFEDVLIERQNKDRALLEKSAADLLGNLTEITALLKESHNPFFAGLNDEQLMDVIVAGYFATRPAAQPGRMIDIGGCLGKMAYTMLKQGWQVDLFEPDTGCAKELTALRVEFAGQLTIYGAVISDQHNVLVPFHQTETGLSGLGASPYSDDHQIIQVPSTRLDCFIAEHRIESLDLLKIDAEGFDFIALDSMGWDHLPSCRWPTLIMLEFGSNFAPQPLNIINSKIAEMGTRGYRALIFSYDDDGNFAHKIWEHRLIDITTDAPALNNQGIASGNIIFYRHDNNGFVAYVLRQLAGMLHASQRPDWA